MSKPRNAAALAKQKLISLLVEAEAALRAAGLVGNADLMKSHADQLQVDDFSGLHSLDCRLRDASQYDPSLSIWWPEDFLLFDLEKALGSRQVNWLNAACNVSAELCRQHSLRP